MSGAWNKGEEGHPCEWDYFAWLKEEKQFAYSINQSRYTIVCLLLVKENHVTNNALKSEREKKAVLEFYSSEISM